MPRHDRICKHLVCRRSGDVVYVLLDGTYFVPRSMTHNDTKYPDPMRFMPERYIDANGQLTDDIAEQQFGFGRRYAPSRNEKRWYVHHIGDVQDLCWQISGGGVRVDSDGICLGGVQRQQGKR